MVIYKIIINSKVYIGQTINFKNRKKEHVKLLASGKHYNAYLQNAFNKYGRFENFTIEEIETCKTIDELNEREQFWIKHYNSLDRNFGYNRREGGLNGKHIKETKQKLSIGEKNGNFGKKWTKEQKEKASKRFKGKYIGDKNPNSKFYYVLELYSWKIEKVKLLDSVKKITGVFDTRRFNKKVTGKKYIVFTEKFYKENINSIDLIAISIIDKSMFKRKIYNESSFFK